MAFSGSNIKCYVDEILKIDFDDLDKDVIKNGTAGLYTQNIVASFSDVSINSEQDKQIFTSLNAEFNVSEPNFFSI